MAQALRKSFSKMYAIEKITFFYAVSLIDSRFLTLIILVAIYL